MGLFLHLRDHFFLFLFALSLSPFSLLLLRAFVVKLNPLFTFYFCLGSFSVPSAPPPYLRGKTKPTFYFLLLPWLFSPRNPFVFLLITFVVKKSMQPGNQNVTPSGFLIIVLSLIYKNNTPSGLYNHGAHSGFTKHTALIQIYNLKSCFLVLGSKIV